MKIKNLEQKVREALLACFQDIPFLEAPQEVTDLYGPGVDFALRVVNRREEIPYLLIAEIKNSGQPRYVNEAINQLRVYQNELENNTYGVLLAPYISGRSARICKENNLGYADLAGNCYLSFSSVFIQREGNPNPFTQERELKSLFYPKSERILRVLLSAGPKDWLTEELADESDTSLGQVSNVKKYLNNQGWLDKETKKLRLQNPFELLAAWAENYTFRKNEVLEYYSLRSPGETEAWLSKTCQEMGLRFGLTGFSGGARYVPVVRYQRVMSYLEGSFDRVASTINLKPVTSGANVMLLKPYDNGVYYNSQMIEGDRVVSPIQAYLDLNSYRGRGEEAAQAILDKVIR